MNSKREKGFFISFVIVLSLLVIFGGFSLTYSLIVVTKDNTILNNIFEIIYMIIHIIITMFALALGIKAIKDGSWVMRNLMYMREHDKIRSKMASTIAMLVMIFNVPIFVYSTLMVFNVVPGFSSFPLKMDLVNVALTVFTVALYFYLYPIIMDSKKGEQ